MGTLITRHLQKRQTNPFAGAVGRNAEGALTFNLGQALKAIQETGSFGATNQQQIADMVSSLGENPTLEAARGYSRDYQGSTGGDADMAVTNKWSPFSGGLGGDALKSAEEAFSIQEKGRADAAAISQEGREKAKISNMGTGIASAQRAALSAAEGAAYDGGEGGTPDVVEGSNLEEDGGGGDAGNANARRRRQSYGGAGLAMRI